jgi:DNA-binding transcriptional MerR regulator
MVRNREKYEQAIQLRQRGFTLAEVAKYCDISKSTASKWLKNKAFSDSVTKANQRRVGAENAKRLKLMSKARTTERNKRSVEIEKSAKTEFRNYQSSLDFCAGLMVYVVAGDRNDEYVIRLSHTDPQVHRSFIAFCERFLGVSRGSIRIWLHLYQNASEQKAMQHWSKVTRLPYSCFYKNHYTQTKQKLPLHFGVGNTIIASTYHKQKLLTWVKLAQKTW